MNTSFGTSLATALAGLVLACIALAPATGAARGGGARASAVAAGARAPAQVDNARADARTRDIRGSSVNNVNGDGGQGRWDHPVAAAIVIGGAVGAIGSTVYAVPVGCVPIEYAGYFYLQCGATWYALQGSEYVLVNPPY